jgi:hypothetical protein
MAEKETKKRGRPFLPDADVKKHYVHVRVSGAEKVELIKMAENLTGGSVSDLIREKVLSGGSH